MGIHKLLNGALRAFLRSLLGCKLSLSLFSWAAPTTTSSRLASAKIEEETPKNQPQSMQTALRIPCKKHEGRSAGDGMATCNISNEANGHACLLGNVINS